jgi:4-hydroxy-tetrahydrodipicolinate synthase
VFSQSVKAMMRTLGLRVGECRLPLGPAPAGTEDRAREVYARLNG